MNKTNFLSFPGLGIEEFRMDKVAFTIFGRDIMWYGIIITLGILCACAYVHYRAKKNEHIHTDHVLDYAIYVVIFGIIGARLYYVLMKFDTFKADNIGDTLYNVVAIWEGGLAIYGGIIAGGITLAIVSLIKKIKVGKAFDMVAPAVMLGQLIGRWGNFCNAEAYGRETTLPWRMGIRALGSNETIFVHPTFLYESLWNLLGFILINLDYKRKKFDGQIFFMYITWYGFGRMLIEGLRTDSLYVGDFRISQVIGFLCFFFGSAILVAMSIVCHLRKKDAALAAAAAGAEASDEADTAAAEIAEAVENTRNDLETIRTMGGADTPYLLDVYRQTRNLSAVIRKASELKTMRQREEQRERDAAWQREEDARRKAERERMEAEQNMAAAPGKEQEEEMYSVVFRVNCTKSQLIALGEYMTKSGISYGKV